MKHHLHNKNRFFTAQKFSREVFKTGIYRLEFYILFNSPKIALCIHFLNSPIYKLRNLKNDFFKHRDTFHKKSLPTNNCKNYFIFID